MIIDGGDRVWIIPIGRDVIVRDVQMSQIPGSNQTAKREPVASVENNNYDPLGREETKYGCKGLI